MDSHRKKVSRLPKPGTVKSRGHSHSQSQHQNQNPTGPGVVNLSSSNQVEFQNQNPVGSPSTSAKVDTKTSGEGGHSPSSIPVYNHHHHHIKQNKLHPVQIPIQQPHSYAQSYTHNNTNSEKSSNLPRPRKNGKKGSSPNKISNSNSNRTPGTKMVKNSSLTSPSNNSFTFSRNDDDFTEFIVAPPPPLFKSPKKSGLPKKTVVGLVKQQSSMSRPSTAPAQGQGQYQDRGLTRPNSARSRAIPTLTAVTTSKPFANPNINPNPKGSFLPYKIDPIGSSRKSSSSRPSTAPPKTEEDDLPIFSASKIPSFLHGKVKEDGVSGVHVHAPTNFHTQVHTLAFTPEGSAGHSNSVFSSTPTPASNSNSHQRPTSRLPTYSSINQSKGNRRTTLRAHTMTSSSSSKNTRNDVKGSNRNPFNPIQIHVDGLPLHLNLAEDDQFILPDAMAVENVTNIMEDENDWTFLENPNQNQFYDKRETFEEKKLPKSKKSKEIELLDDIFDFIEKTEKMRSRSRSSSSSASSAASSTSLDCPKISVQMEREMTKVDEEKEVDLISDLTQSPKTMEISDSDSPSDVEEDNKIKVKEEVGQDDGKVDEEQEEPQALNVEEREKTPEKFQIEMEEGPEVTDSCGISFWNPLSLFTSTATTASATVDADANKNPEPEQDETPISRREDEDLQHKPEVAPTATERESSNDFLQIQIDTDEIEIIDRKSNQSISITGLGLHEKKRGSEEFSQFLPPVKTSSHTSENLIQLHSNSSIVTKKDSNNNNADGSQSQLENLIGQKDFLPGSKSGSESGKSESESEPELEMEFEAESPEQEEENEKNYNNIDKEKVDKIELEKNDIKNNIVDEEPVEKIELEESKSESESEQEENMENNSVSNSIPLLGDNETNKNSINEEPAKKPEQEEIESDSEPETGCEQVEIMENNLNSDSVPLLEEIPSKENKSLKSFLEISQVEFSGNGTNPQKNQNIDYENIFTWRKSSLHAHFHTSSSSSHSDSDSDSDAADAVEICGTSKSASQSKSGSRSISNTRASQNHQNVPELGENPGEISSRSKTQLLNFEDFESSQNSGLEVQENVHCQPSSSSTLEELKKKSSTNFPVDDLEALKTETSLMLAIAQAIKVPLTTVLSTEQEQEDEDEDDELPQTLSSISTAESEHPVDAEVEIKIEDTGHKKVNDNSIKGQTTADYTNLDENSQISCPPSRSKSPKSKSQFTRLSKKSFTMEIKVETSSISSLSDDISSFNDRFYPNSNLRQDSSGKNNSGNQSTRDSKRSKKSKAQPPQCQPRPSISRKNYLTPTTSLSHQNPAPILTPPNSVVASGRTSKNPGSGRSQNEVQNPQQFIPRQSPHVQFQQLRSNIGPWESSQGFQIRNLHRTTSKVSENCLAQKLSSILQVQNEGDDPRRKVSTVLLDSKTREMLGKQSMEQLVELDDSVSMYNVGNYLEGSMEISNISPTTVCFRVTSRVPGRYQIIPPYGKLEVNQTTNLSVTSARPLNYVKRESNQFKVEAVAVAHDNVSTPYEQKLFWKEVDSIRDTVDVKFVGRTRAANPTKSRLLHFRDSDDMETSRGSDSCEDSYYTFSQPLNFQEEIRTKIERTGNPFKLIWLLIMLLFSLLVSYIFQLSIFN